MENEKKQVREIVNNTSEDTKLDDALYLLYFNEKIKRSKNDIKNGKVMTVEQSKERMHEKYEGFNVR